jgi:hypothetical protein
VRGGFILPHQFSVCKEVPSQFVPVGRRGRGGTALARPRRLHHVQCQLVLHVVQATGHGQDPLHDGHVVPGVHAPHVAPPLVNGGLGCAWGWGGWGGGGAHMHTHGRTHALMHRGWARVHAVQCWWSAAQQVSECASVGMEVWVDRQWAPGLGKELPAWGHEWSSHGWGGAWCACVVCV